MQTNNRVYYLVNVLFVYNNQEGVEQEQSENLVISYSDDEEEAKDYFNKFQLTRARILHKMRELKPYIFRYSEVAIHFNISSDDRIYEPINIV